MKFKLRLTLITIALAVLIGSAAGCGTTLKDAPPIINSFTTTPAGISTGERTTLSWDVSGATKINIQPGIGTVGPSGTLLLTPPDTISYTLTATNQAGSTTGSATVTVTPVVVTGKPDLVITDMWLTGSAVNYKIANLGDADAKSSQSYFYINDLKQSNDLVEPLAAGEERTTSFGNFNWNFLGVIPISGDPTKVLADFNVKACTDAENDIEESAEGNNCLVEIWGPQFMYNFADSAHMAEWRNENGKLIWPVVGDSGSVYLPPGDIMIICPPKVSNGWIQAKFGDFYAANFWTPLSSREIEIPQKAKFTAMVSLMAGTPTDSASIAFGYLDTAGSLVLSPKMDVSSGEAPRVYEVDLSDLAGKKTEFFIRVEAKGGPIKGCVKWEKPRITQE
ncbi:CARDB domain-containing protein [Chloroflexota bacterium]